MNSIQIGRIISENRRRKGVTQEELANHLGISKPAVSKWESGQSYPDILLLPVIAAYFDISVDQLIGYEPQMTKEDVRKLYQRLAEAFAKKPFEQVYAECEEYIKKYYSCWYLLFKLAVLYVNHCSLAGSQEKAFEMLKRAVAIFNRIEKNGDDISLTNQSLQLEAFCYLSMQQPVEAIDLLEGLCEPQLQPERLLAKAYQMKGEKDKAAAYLQGVTFINLSNILNAAPDFFMMYADQPAKMDCYYQIFSKLCGLFEIEQLQPAVLYTMYLTAAAVYVMQEKKEEALDVLEKYAELARRSGKELFRLHGSTIFDALEQYLSLVDIETAAPRNSEVIWRDIRNALLNNPAFQGLEAEPRFENLKKKLAD